jgi:hypothetical protein
MHGHSPDQGVRRHAVGDDAQQHSPTRRQHDGMVAGQLFVEDEDRKNDRG